MAPSIASKMIEAEGIEKLDHLIGAISIPPVYTSNPTTVTIISRSKAFIYSGEPLRRHLMEQLMEQQPMGWNPPPPIQDIFPLLKLPENALKRVLELFECVDLIDFSLCSRSCKLLTQTINHRIDSIDLSVMANNTMIMLKSGLDSRAIIDFESTWPYYLQTTFRFINRIRILVCKQGEIYYCRNSIPLQGPLTLPIKPITDYLIELFEAPLNIVVIPTGFNLRAVLPEFIKCESLEVAGVPYMAPDDMRYLFETIKPNGRFSLKVRNGAYFYPPELPLFFDVDNLEMINTAEWMTGEIFLRLSCNRIRLSYCQLRAQDLEGFVLQWYFSNSTHMEYVEVWHNVTPGLMTFKNCLVRMPDNLLRGRYYNNTPTTYIDCNSGLDMIRKDGTIATVLACTRSFHFIIWKERFPAYGGTQLFLV
ncbi:hypothetical protein CAEBREN_08104 [Caenorhabditis brenneri]|uniref:F-box domain-containing protein n=1 Tax=Caenorhabditis brenneri TaxID=135651 RepID=G0MJD8_CAEBE|nr:hypothetical protein CAEBREN_08104 [Caenorhabditis brenneri]